MRWLAPAGEVLRAKGQAVLQESDGLSGSGRLFNRLYARSESFDLTVYAKADARLHRHDFDVSARAWQSSSYDVIVGDEAFWLLAVFLCDGLRSRPHSCF